MNPSLERAAPPTSAAPMTPIPNLAKKIIGVSFPRTSVALFGVRVARVYPDADIFIVAAHSHQRGVAYIFERLDRGFDVELVLGGIRDEGLDDIPRNSDVHAFVGTGILVSHVHDQLSVLFGDANGIVRVAAGVLHGDKFAFGRGFEGVENGAHVYVVRVEVADANFAVAQLSVVDGRNDLLSQHQGHVDPHQFVAGWVSDSYVKIARRGSG